MNACKTAKSRQAFGQTNRQTDKEIFKQKELRERQVRKTRNSTMYLS